MGIETAGVSFRHQAQEGNLYCSRRCSLQTTVGTDEELVFLMINEDQNEFGTDPTLKDIFDGILRNEDWEHQYRFRMESSS